MAQDQKPKNDEITPLNAEELDADQLEDVAGGTEAQQELAADGCGVNKCGVNW